MINLKNAIILIASVALIGIGINAFAQGGMMGDGSGWMHGGYGMMQHHGNHGHHDQLTKEEYRQLDQERAAFITDTKDIRAELYEKENQLQSELAKTDTDVTKAAKLQRDISDLQAQIDQKRINHIVKMKKLNPKFDDYTMHDGTMMRYGMHGKGDFCWN